jgi:hypothetical protein
VKVTKCDVYIVGTWWCGEKGTAESSLVMVSIENLCSFLPSLLRIKTEVEKQGIFSLDVSRHLDVSNYKRIDRIKSV